MGFIAAMDYWLLPSFGSLYGTFWYCETQERTYVDGHMSERLQLKVTVQKWNIVDIFLDMFRSGIKKEKRARYGEWLILDQSGIQRTCLQKDKKKTRQRKKKALLSILSSRS